MFERPFRIATKERKGRKEEEDREFVLQSYLGGPEAGSRGQEGEPSYIDFVILIITRQKNLY